MDGTDRHYRSGCVNRHAAAVEVVQAHHAVDVRVFRQQIAFDDFHHVIHYARHAVHAGSNAEQILGADAAVRVAVAFEGIALQRRKRFRHAGRQRKRVQRRRFRQRHQRLLNPAALRYRANGIADDFTVTYDFAVSRDIHQGDFMSLRNMLNQFQPVRKAGARF